jgi:hypothetical protein
MEDRLVEHCLAVSYTASSCTAATGGERRRKAEPASACPAPEQQSRVWAAPPAESTTVTFSKSRAAWSPRRLARPPRPVPVGLPPLRARSLELCGESRICARFSHHHDTDPNRCEPVWCETAFAAMHGGTGRPHMERADKQQQVQRERSRVPRQRSLRRVLSAIGGAAGTRRRASTCNDAEQLDGDRQRTVLLGRNAVPASRSRAWPLTPENTPALPLRATAEQARRCTRCRRHEVPRNSTQNGGCGQTAAYAWSGLASV